MGWRPGENVVGGHGVAIGCRYGTWVWVDHHVQVWWVDMGWPLGAGIVCALGEGVQ